MVSYFLLCAAEGLQGRSALFVKFSTNDMVNDSFHIVGRGTGASPMYSEIQFQKCNAPLHPAVDEHKFHLLNLLPLFSYTYLFFVKMST
jgi:hypothetical protein